MQRLSLSHWTRLVSLAVLLCALALAVAPGAALAAGPWYVSPSGNDANDCLTETTACLTIQAAIDKASAGDTVNVTAGTYVLTSVVNVNKDGITLDGAGAGATIVQVSGAGDRFDISAAGATLQDFEIQKTDKTGLQEIIRIRNSNITIKNNTIHGQFVIGDGEVSRAMVINAGAFSGLNIEGNTFYDLRQPLYISGTHTGTIQNNHTYRTKGWVLEGGNLTFTGNTWGTGADANVYDIAILATMPAAYYTDIVAMSNANNGAVVEDQRVSPAVLSVVYVDAATSYTTDLGGRYHPYSTIAPAITRVVAGGTVNVAAGTYTGNIGLTKPLTLRGANAGIHPAVGTHPTETVGSRGPESILSSTYALNPSADNITIDGFKFTGAGGRIIDTYANANKFHLTNSIFDIGVRATTTGVIQFGGGSHTDMLLDFNLFLDKGDHTLYTGGGPFDRMRVVYNKFSSEGDSIFWTASALVDGVIEGNEFDGAAGVASNTINIGQGGNLIIRDNWFHDNLYTPLQVGLIGGSITGNTFERVYPYSTFGGDAFQLWGGQWGTAVSTNVTIENNLIRYNDVAGATVPVHGLRLRPPETGTGIDASTIHVRNNAFINGGVRSDAKAIRHQGDVASTLDATNNWWGTTSGGVIATMVEGPVDFEPWIATYVDDPTKVGRPGFWPVSIVLETPCSTACYVATTGSDSGSGKQLDPFLTIQKGIDTVTAGGTVNVAAGTYVEDPVIDKAVTLLGPNANINPNTGTRVAEAVILPAVSAPNPSVCEVMVYIKVSNVTIKGFSFDGDNPALTSGILIDGADVDACEIMAGYEGMGNIVVENNILKHATYSGIDFYNYTNSAATAGNYIRYNRIEDIGETTYNWGVGILIYNNFYADITDNVLTGVRTGIQTGNFSKANVGSTGSISNNQIGVWRLGIFHNLAYGSASPLTISGNTLTAETYPGANKWNGILLSSLGSGINATITNNTITIPAAVSFAAPGYAAGYNVWNVAADTPIVISGGTVTGGDYGVFVNNYEGYVSNANNTAIAIDGITVLGSKVAGVYVKDSPSNTNSATVYANIQNSTIDTDATGILVEGADATAKANLNNLAGNPTFGVSNTNPGATVDAENNWWGTACSPASKVNGLVDFTPWWGDATGSFSLTANATAINVGDSAAQQMAVINCAAPGTTVTYPFATYPGGVIVTANGVTIDLNGATVGHGTPAFTIVGDDVTLMNGILDGTGNTDGSAGVLVTDGADNFILQDMETKNWAVGVEVAGSHESLKVVNNWIHLNTGAGLQVNAGATLTGIVTIQGNLFKANGVGITSAVALNAEYNSWGTKAAPPTMPNVDADPWTFSELYFDVDPTTAGDQYVRHVNETNAFDVTLMAEAENLYGLGFKFTYDKDKLTLNTKTLQAPWAGACAELLPQPAGTVAYVCNLLSGPEWDGGAIATFNFTANAGPAGPGPWTALFDIAHLPADTNSGALGGIKVFVNNAGFDAASVAARDITDTNDGEITIDGLANYTGFVDLQGRANDSGAVFEVYNQAATSGATVYASGTTASSGKYTTAYASLWQLVIGQTYYFQVDRALYLPTTAIASYNGSDIPTDWQHSKLLATRPLQNVTTVVLSGGDASNDNVIDITDAGCIGGAYGLAPAACGTGGTSDVNEDGRMDILDLTLMGGNFTKTSSDPMLTWAP